MALLPWAPPATSSLCKVTLLERRPVGLTTCGMRGMNLPYYCRGLNPCPQTLPYPLKKAAIGSKGKTGVNIEVKSFFGVLFPISIG